MLSFPIQISATDITKEMAELNRKVTKGLDVLKDLTDDDVDIGSTPKEIIYTQDRLRLYHYQPLVDRDPEIKSPMLIVPPLINGYEVADLQPDRSLVRNLLKQGIDVHLIDWGYPRPADKYLTMDDYVNGYIDDCVDFVREYHDVDTLTLLGICQGGTMSTCYSALNPDKIDHLALTVTPIDFHVGQDKDHPHVGLLFTMGHGVDVDKMVDAFGNVPADLLNVSFLMAAPFALNVGKYADVVDILDNKKSLLNFLRMEKWLFGGPAAVGEAYREFVKKFLQQNALVNGELELGGQKVDLKNVTMPVLNVYAQRDHLVPPPCTVALGKHVGSKDYTELQIKTGHIGIYTGGASQKILAPGVGKWLREGSVD
jgi:polyhydroxyalkanoate synthase